jgi:hypothetical protein
VKLIDLTQSERYTGVSLNRGRCEFTFTLYPSKQFESMYITKKPLVSSFIAVGIFLFTSIIFLIYDGWVEERQRKIHRVALQSSAFISSLFPTSVRDRLFHEDVDEGNKNSDVNKMAKRGSLQARTSIKHHLKQWCVENSGHNVVSGTPKKLSASMRVRNSINTCTESSASVVAIVSNPIADLFPEATGM